LYDPAGKVIVAFPSASVVTGSATPSIVIEAPPSMFPSRVVRKFAWPVAVVCPKNSSSA